jgi:uncharacterized protein
MAEASEPYRQCIVTRQSLPAAELVRFVVGPQGQVVPDIEGRLPGRGLWLVARRDIVEKARKAQAFAKAARCQATVEGDLGERVEALLVQRCLALIGLARRAGQAVAGYEAVRRLVAEGKAELLLAARDGAEGGRGKLKRLPGAGEVVELLDRAELGAVFGRDDAVHVALTRGNLAERVRAELKRLAGFRSSPVLEKSE